MTATHCCPTSRKAGEAAEQVQAAFFGGRPKAVAVDLVRLIHSPSTYEDLNKHFPNPL